MSYVSCVLCPVFKTFLVGFCLRGAPTMTPHLAMLLCEFRSWSLVSANEVNKSQRHVYFPGKHAQDIMAPRSRSSAKKSRSEPRATPPAGDVKVNGAELADLFRLLFGDRPEGSDVERWLQVGFQFSTAPGTEWGLWQRQGGPCGVFAPVQALKCSLPPFRGKYRKSWKIQNLQFSDGSGFSRERKTH